MGPDKLKQGELCPTIFTQRSEVPFVVPPPESPKVMGLVVIHNLDALCCFSGINNCLWCGKEGQNEGIVVNHLWTVYYRLGLVCNRCHDCPSITADTLCCHGWQDCHQLGEKNPNKSVSSE